ncbi:MAG TPA: cytochrome c maturation protein CcmE [Burkholderiales bacterium]|nr:cytochrome c maturation protein CcmE [Burkholderiales bacterium]
MKARHKRFALIGVALALLGGAAALVFSAFQSNLVFFFSPSQVYAKEAPTARNFRLGGMVEDGSVKKQDDGLTVHFAVTDSAQSVPVVYKGILPDLFREGKGVVAEGRLTSEGVFVANQVLAKHDENYMPPEAADAMKKAKAVNEQAAKSLVLPQEQR